MGATIDTTKIIDDIDDAKGDARKRIERAFKRDPERERRAHENALRQLRKLSIDEQALVLTDGKSSSD